MKKFFAEFKTFVTRGNVIDLAVGVIIGAAFQRVVSSLTDNIISPILGLFAGRNFDTLTVTVLGATIGYGTFITAIIDFVIMALVVFLIVKFVNKLTSLGQKPAADAKPAAPTTKTCPYCRSEIAIEATRCPHCTSALDEG
jgi:large conductance mechanosensitive channel